MSEHTRGIARVRIPKPIFNMSPVLLKWGHLGSDFHLVLALIGFGLIAVAPLMIMPVLFAPKKPSPVKQATYESGQVPVGEGRVSMMMQYYVYLLIFVVFDVVSMFLYAWGAVYLNVGFQSTYVILLLLLVLLIPIGYALKLSTRRELW